MEKIQKQKIILITLIVIILIEIFTFSRMKSKEADITYETNQSSSLLEEENNVDEEYPNLTYLTYTEFKEMYESNTRFVTVIIQTSCGYCLQYKPVVNEIAKEEGIKVYVLDILKMTDSEIEELLSMIPYFTENPSWGTPLSIIVQNKEEIGVLSGFASKEATVNFYQENGLIS